MSSNAYIGATFENTFCKMLKDRGFWALRITPNAVGQQPADIVAVKGKYAVLIDCKVVSTNKGFNFYRIEDNQFAAMERFEKVSGETGWFAIRLEDGTIRMAAANEIDWILLSGKNSLTPSELLDNKYTMSLQDWLERAETKC